LIKIFYFILLFRIILFYCE